MSSSKQEIEIPTYYQLEAQEPQLREEEGSQIDLEDSNQSEDSSWLETEAEQRGLNLLLKCLLFMLSIIIIIWQIKMYIDITNL
jgi:hypothetical protein